MTPPPRPPSYERRQRAWILAIAVGVSLVFFAVIRAFLVTMILAAIAAALATPAYRWLRDASPLRRLRHPSGPAAVTTVLLVLLLILIPLAGLLGVVVDQAINISQKAGPWIAQTATQPDAFDELVRRVPLLERVAPYKAQVMQKAAEAVSALGGFLARNLAMVTRGAIAFLLHLFVMLYAMFFFLRDGAAILRRVLALVPLPAADEQRILGKFVSVSRATIKGTLVIGIVQGVLGGLAFKVAGIDGSVFWGMMMVVLSIIPGLGPALVWIPALLYLVLGGNTATAIVFALWFLLVVGTIDNFLRPRLVGRDTQMPDLLILLSTLGGIAVFGPVGIIIGPIVAAVFLTVWEIAETFLARDEAAA